MCRWLVIAVALLSVLPPSVAYAAEVMVEGVLKAVDAKERTLTLEKKTASARCRCGSVFEIPPKDDQMGCD